MTKTYLSFVVCDELFAVDVTNVLEVLQKQHVTKVPNAPKHIKGIINFRGEIVPVFDSRTKFNLPELDITSAYVIIVLDLSKQNETFRIGAIVDKVKDVINIDDTELKSVPKMSENFNTEFLHGIFKLKESFILLLNVEKVFSDTEILEMRDLKEIENLK
jgi:purine-binding chemotaxis protein CheW